ncbi:hypothetical protein HELRODRAFT_92407, partial [Helobdella robusta]|uniref:YEATS domain-containing protein 4 n=1 Tax=Helobdella robusta TaxID=6412 RepID=T1G8F7_HELRO
GITVVKPIVYGNIASYFGKKREEDGHTHQWTVFVKSYANEDMSVYVKKMNFKLHESYANTNRVITRPPYEVTETGWGEFEVIIKIYFNDPNEKPVTIYHLLKLFQSDTDIMSGKKNLVSESYDEMASNFYYFPFCNHSVFQDPSVLMHRLLTQPRPLHLGNYMHETNFEEKKQRQLAAIEQASAKIKQQIQKHTDHLKQCKEDMIKFKQEINRLDGGNAFMVGM